MAKTHVEALLISAVLRTTDHTTPMHQGISSNQFHVYKSEWRWIEKFIARYRKVPGKVTFQSKFPEFTIKAVDDVLHFCEETKREHARYLLTELTDAMLDHVDRDNIEEALKVMQSGLIHVQSSLQGESGDFSLLDDYDLVYEDVKRRVELVETKGTSGVPTGFGTLDDATGGPQPGDYFVVAARVGSGKTWTLNAMVLAAMRAGYSSAYFALEQTRNQIAFRLFNLLSSKIGKRIFSSSDLRMGKNFDLLEFKKFLDSLKSSSLGGVHIADSSRGKVTPLTIASHIERVKPDIVFVDYLTLMDTKDKDWQSVAKMSNEIKQLAQRYEIPIVCAAQINRMGAGKEPPKVEHLGMSDAIGQDADAVITMAQQSPHVMRFRIAKLREGPDQGTFFAHFNPGKGVYGEISANRASEIIEMDEECD